MKPRILLACAMIVLSCGPGMAQITGDVIGVHNLGPGSKSPITGARPDFCLYCHAPHTSMVANTAPLWNQTLSTQTYTPYTSTTYHESGNTQPLLGADSSLCLSCHDGTVAPGTTAAYGKVTMTGSMTTTDVLGTNLASSHPFSLILPITDAADLVATLASSGQTADTTGAVKLINGNIECTSCHNAHVQAKDAAAQNFLVKDSSSGGLCLACHDPNRTMTGQVNPLTGWYQSIHATSTASVQNLPYPTLTLNACVSCHTNHNAPGAAWLLRGAGDQDCLTCHSSTAVAPATVANAIARNMPLAPTVTSSPVVSSSLNIASEYAKIGHPLATTNNTITAGTQARSKAQTQTQTVSPNTPSQSGCVNCHDPHSVQQVTTFTAAPAVRASQRAVVGVSDKDGITLLKPAQNQFEVCLRCHGSSQGKIVDTTKYGYTPVRLTSVADPRNVVAQFSATSTSSHPVTRGRSSPLPQPSLLLNMWNLNGTTLGHAMGNQIFCTDCHNSDDNREFGGTGPNGPHGSQWMHILERRYEFSQTLAPGQLITNLLPNPDLSVNGPYALCAKCHNLSLIMQNTSFKQHSYHLNAGFSCSTCHTAHGMGASNANVSGERLVNFDINVVVPNGPAPISYNRGANTCTLTCHGTKHNPDGTVSTASATRAATK